MGKTHERFLFRIWFPCKSVSQYVDRSSQAEAWEFRDQNIDFSLMLGEESEAPVRNLSAKLFLFGFFSRNHIVWLAENELHFQGRKGPFF